MYRRNVPLGAADQGRRGKRKEERGGMAACNLGGVSNIKVFDLYQDKKIKYSKLVTSYKTKAIRLERFNGLKGIQIRNEPMNVASFVWQTRRSTCSFVVSCGLLPGRNDTKEEILVAKPSISDRTIPVPSEVLSLLTTVCDTTSIAEFKLDLSGFRLYVKRNLDNEDIQSPGPSLPVIQSSTSNQTPDLNGTVATASLVTSNTKPSSAGIQSILDAASDEGLVILQSPKVGLFRRSRTIKGKRAPPSCKVKQEVKEGQVLCFIEQLGGEIPIESDVSGEVIKILREDGEPVGYGDALMAILPSFPGIKKLQ